MTTAAEYIVVPLIKAYSALRPDVSVTVSVDNRQGVFTSVLEHRADVAIGGRPPADGGLVGTPFLKNEIVAITTPDDPLVGEPAGTGHAVVDVHRRAHGDEGRGHAERAGRLKHEADGQQGHPVAAAVGLGAQQQARGSGAQRQQSGHGLRAPLGEDQDGAARAQVRDGGGEQRLVLARIVTRLLAPVHGQGADGA